MAAERWTPWIGGCGGVFFQVTEDSVSVTVQKRDRNRGRSATPMRLLKMTPDRRLLTDVTLADDGAVGTRKTGPVQEKTLVLSPYPWGTGIYALMVSVANDRYGNDVDWRFKTNCPRFVIETSRGHRDRRHEEPIVLRDGETDATVCFRPRRRGFKLNLDGVAAGTETVVLRDGAGKVVTTLALANGKGSATLPSGARDNLPWVLEIPGGQGTIRADGLTRWDKEDPYPDAALWSPFADSWFPMHNLRGLITPYHVWIADPEGTPFDVVFTVRNSSPERVRATLALEPPGVGTLDAEAFELGPGEARPVTLRGVTGGDTGECRVRVTVPDGTTHASVRLHASHPTLVTPWPLRPYRHENAQFGYRPAYPVENQVYPGPDGTPFVRTSAGIASWQGDHWHTAPARQDMGRPHAGPWSKVAFGADGDVYAVALADGEPAILRSSDGGLSFTTTPVPAEIRRRSSFDIEQFSGHNIPSGVPPVVRYTRTTSDPKVFWRRYGDLELFLPRRSGDGVDWGDPIPVSGLCLGASSHSGIPSALVSRGSRVHVAWGEATDPAAKAPGVPAFVATYDRDTGVLGKPNLVGHGPPANDVHNTPCITMDSKGYLHVLVGTHGRAFRYARSLEPNTADAGWTDAVSLGDGLRQTYVGLVCDQQDTLHVVFRLWQRDRAFHPEGMFATLAHMWKRPDGDWEGPNTLVVAPFSDYSIFYHRLSIGRRGELLLSYDYWSTYWFYRNDRPHRKRSLLLSDDGGTRWRLATNDDLVPEG